jgi:acyl carrier protein
MLDLDLDLEADLGIDTVKQAETFAAIRETFAIPVQEGLNLREYSTLASVVGFVRKHRPDLVVISSQSAVAAAPVAQSPISQAPVADVVISQVLEVVAAKTGYPQDMLDLDLDLEADLGIDTVKQAETFAAIRETFAIPVQEGLNLREYSTLASVVGFVRKNRPDLAVASQPAVLSPVPAVAAAPAAQSPISQSPVADVVVSQVLDVVANKTGYPKDMLELDLDLEADLGIDTVKQAETFASIRETFNIPVQEGLNLRDYPTLAAVVGFVRQHRPDLAVTRQSAGPSPVPAVAAAPAAQSPNFLISNLQSSVSDTITEKVLDVVSAKTGYPKDMLELDLDLEADLGIDTVKQAETFATVREAFNIPVQEGLNLRDYPTLASVVGFVKTMRPDLAGEERGGNKETASQATPIAQSPDLQSPVSDPVVDKVLEVVSTKTGYPTEMLELDQDMEADLGIDTVKQAETFASIREAFDIPVQEGLNLRDYPTLQSVITFVHKMRP